MIESFGKPSSIELITGQRYKNRSQIITIIVILIAK